LRAGYKNEKDGSWIGTSGGAKCCPKKKYKKRVGGWENQRPPAEGKKAFQGRGKKPERGEKIPLRSFPRNNFPTDRKGKPLTLKPKLKKAKVCRKGGNAPSRGRDKVSTVRRRGTF